MSPGAGNIINYMNPDRMDVLQKEPTQMTLNDWEVFMEAFKSWPLHPTVCYSFSQVPCRRANRYPGFNIATVSEDDR